MSKSFFERTTFGAMRVHVLPTTHFKTNTICLTVGFPLRESTVTGLSLLAHIMRRVSRQYPHAELFKQKLEDLYGAIFAVDLQKKGDYQFITFTIDVVADELLPPRESSLLREGLAFLFSALQNPAVQDGAFLEKYVLEETRNIDQKLQAVINDKEQFASKRCLEEMCSNHPFRFNVNGVEAQLSHWDGVKLYKLYRDWRDQSIYDLHVVGNVSTKLIHDILGEVAHSFHHSEQKPLYYHQPKLLSFRQKPLDVEDQLEVNQGKLLLGVRTSIQNNDPLASALKVYNGLLGGFAHSKLFVNVREKHSLAYTAFSRMVDSSLGFLMIHAGIDISKKEMALSIILEQLQLLHDGVVSEQEMEQTKALLANAYRSLSDSAYELISFDFAQQFVGTQQTPQMMLENLAKVNLQAIQEVARTIELDTIYFLRNRGE